MSKRLPMLAMALAAMAAGASPSCAAVVENLTRAPYLVTGSTEAEVRADINAKRSGNYDARVRWYFRWRYTYNKTAAGCSMEHVTITLQLTLIEPALRSPNADVQKSFGEYKAKLDVHEQGHPAISRNTARRIDAALKPLTAVTCNALDERANQVARALVAENNAAQSAYDTRTDHGATQGARWPRRTITTAPAPPQVAAPGGERDRSQYQAVDPQPTQPSAD